MLVIGAKSPIQVDFKLPFRDCSDEFLEIEFAEVGAEKLVFNRKEIASATESILSDKNIRKQFSADLEATWNNGKSK